MDWITNPEIWVALITLTTLEVVLGIDNVIFTRPVVSLMVAGYGRRRSTWACLPRR